MHSPISAEQLRALPFFPLPGLVFFPGTLLPLHMFEPRYRELIAWCVENDSPLAVTRIRPGHEGEQPGDPPVEEICGVGHIIRHQRTADGRYNIMLEGAARVRLVEELPNERGFRVARAELLDEEWPEDPTGLQLRVATLRALSASLGSLYPAAASALGALLTEGPARLVDGLAALVLTEPDERQAAIEALRLDARAALVERHMVDLMSSTPAEGEPIEA